MSVLIKGLIMPSCCDGCTFSDWSNLHQTARCKMRDYAPCFADYSREYEDKRADFCPLVEIPTHGRLIDADAYCEDLLREAHRVWGLLKPETIERINRTVDDLKKYPAIIEAEGNDGEYEREDDDTGTLEISLGGLLDLYHKVKDAPVVVIEAEGSENNDD